MEFESLMNIIERRIKFDYASSIEIDLYQTILDYSLYRQLETSLCEEKDFEFNRKNISELKNNINKKASVIANTR